MNFKNVKEFIPTLASSFVILGIIKAMIFYYVFGIRILDYIDFSESLLLFLDDIILIILPILIAYVVNLFVIKQLKETDKINTKIFKRNAFLLGLLIIVPNTLYIFLILQTYFQFNLIWSGLCAILVVILGITYFTFTRSQMESDIENINNEVEPRKKKVLKDSFVFNIGITLFLCFIINAFVYRTYTDLNIAIFREPEKAVICNLKDSTIIKSGKDTLYVGQTRQNIFFYSLSNRKSMILKFEDVKTIETKILKPQQPSFFQLF